MNLEKALTSITLAKQNLETLIGAAAKTFPTIYAVNIATHLDVAEHELRSELGTRDKPEKHDEKAFATNAHVANILDIPISHIENLPPSMTYARQIIHHLHELAQASALNQHMDRAARIAARDARIASTAAILFQQARRDVLMDLYMGILRDGVLRDDPTNFHSPLASAEAIAFRLGAYLIDAARKNEML